MSPLSRLAVGLAVLWLAISAGLAVRVSQHRGFQVDETEHLHAAYLTASGEQIYTDFWQLHHPLLYAVLAPITDPEDPVRSYGAARLLMLLMLFGTVVSVGWGAKFSAERLARHLGAASPSEAGMWAGILGAGAALGHTTLIERGMEVRPDGPTTFFITAALAVELSGRGSDRVRHSLSAVLLSFAFLTTQKAVFACFFFGCLWLFRALRLRCPGRVLWPMVAWSAPLALVSLYMTVQGNFAAFVQLCILDAVSAVSGADYRTPFSPMDFVVAEAGRNVGFCALAVIGAGLAARFLSTPEGRAVATFPAVFAMGSVASLWANPFPWPYVHVLVVPSVALVTGTFCAVALARRAKSRDWRPGLFPLATVLCLFLLWPTAAPRLLEQGTPLPGHGGQAKQMTLLQEIERIAESDDAWFDLAGMYFQPDAFRYYALSEDLYGWYQAGDASIVDSLRRHEVVGITFNYRTGHMVAEEKRFVREHFVHYFQNLFVLGCDLAGAPADTDLPFELLKTKVMRYDGPGVLRVDGAPFREGVLEKGVHTLRLDRSPDRARLILKTPEPVPEPAAPGAVFVPF